MEEVRYEVMRDLLGHTFNLASFFSTGIGAEIFDLRWPKELPVFLGTEMFCTAHLDDAGEYRCWLWPETIEGLENGDLLYQLQTAKKESGALIIDSIQIIPL